MNALSALDAISPAIERTKRFLFQPFEWMTYLKLCVVACITEGFSTNFNSSTNSSSGSGSGPSIAFSPSSLEIAEIVFALLLALVVCIFIAYLVTRLRFAFFHCLVRNTREIGPGWKLYRIEATRFFMASLVVWLCFFVLLILVALPFIGGFYEVFQSAKSGDQFNVFHFVLLFLPFLGIVFVLALAGWIADVVLHDFILPHMALENASFRAAWAAVRSRIAAEKGAFFVYFLLRAILPFVAMIGLMIVAAIPVLIVVGIVALIVAGFHGAFEDATGAAAAIGVAFEVLVGIIGLAFGLVVAFSLGGPIATWIRNYALVFYGGRYAPLGEMLFPSPPPTPTPGA
jgi:hypothetical protein